MKIDILNGPNLNLQGARQPEIYGSETFEIMLRRLQERHMDVEIGYFQSNHEGQLIDRLHQAAKQGIDGIVLNAGALSHYSIALRDAVEATSIPVVEVHMSNIYGREEFRRHSVLSAVCAGVIVGLGMDSYELAVHYFTSRKRK